VPQTDPQLLAAARLLARADALLVAAGAGMGVDSGLPDFRGEAGFWRAYPALGRRGISFAEAASPQTFDDDPTLAWGFYGHRLALYRQTVPHAGFGILRRWAKRMPHGAAVFTSNVDGQFQAAGFAPERIVECHGSIHHLQCSVPCSDTIWSAEVFLPEVDEAECRLLNAAPRCPRCGALARPNILMFGDGAWLEGRSEAQRERLDGWLARAERVLVVEMGAGTAIPSVRRFGERAARAPGGALIRINPREADVQRACDLALPGPALATLHSLDTLLAAGTEPPA
jgi:NAD-dependent SIR2 family protein deacetylase